MKRLFLATALLIPPLVGAAQSPGIPPSSELSEAIAPPVDDDGPLSPPRHIGFGMKPETVIEAMKGPPDQRLTPDIWVYWNFQSGIVGAGKFDTLVVFFSQQRVVKYRLVERKAMRALLGELRKAPPAGAGVAAK